MFWLLCFVSCVVKRRDGDIKGSDKNGDVTILVPTYLLAYLRYCFRNVLSFVYQACDFRLLNFVFYVLCFGFCVSCFLCLTFVFRLSCFDVRGVS